MTLTRRTLLKASAATAALATVGAPAVAQAIDELVIAYNVNLPSWDPTVGPSAVNPTIQGIYQSVFDMFIHQNPDLSFDGSGLLTDWGWNDDRTQVWMDVREGVTWHNGDPFTAEDVAWSLERAGKPETGNPIQFIWGKIGNITVDGNRVTADVLEYEPTLFKWMSFPDRLRPAEEILRGGRGGGLRGGARGHGSLHGGRLRAQCLRQAQGQSELLEGRASLRHGDDQVRDRRREPGGRDRIGQFPRNARDDLRGV